MKFSIASIVPNDSNLSTSNFLVILYVLTNRIVIMSVIVYFDVFPFISLVLIDFNYLTPPQFQSRNHQDHIHYLQYPNLSCILLLHYWLLLLPHHRNQIIPIQNLHYLLKSAIIPNYIFEHINIPPIASIYHQSLSML